MNIGTSKLDIYIKQPDEILPIEIGFGKLHILPRGATKIVSATASAKRWKRKFPQYVEGANDFLASTTAAILPPNETTVRITTTGGLDGYDYVISLSVTFDNGAILEDEIYVRVKEPIKDINFISDTVTGGFNLDRLLDVQITSPINGQILQYNATSDSWSNVTPSSGGVAPGGNTGQVLTKLSNTNFDATWQDPSVSNGDKGDITVSNSGNTWTIDNKSVTYAKMQDVSATNRILGRESAGSGVIEEIICTSAGRALLDDVDASTQRTTLGLGQLSTQPATISSPTAGNVLVYNSSGAWQNVTPQQASSNNTWINGVQVNINNLNNNDLLQYNSTSAVWKNVPQSDLVDGGNF